MAHNTDTIKGVGKAQTFDGSPLRIGIVHARWNTIIIDALMDGVMNSLTAAGVEQSNIIVQSVPGSYELPFAAKAMYLGSKRNSSIAPPFDAVIAIGALIKGETMHFEYISDAVSHGLMKVQLDDNVPVVFGLLTLLTEAQGLARAGLGDSSSAHNHGLDWGNAAVELGVKRKAWSSGNFV